MNKRKQHDDEDFECNHDRAGIVTNQPDGYDHNRAHASVSVCGDPTCRAGGLAWVRAKTGEPGVYISDSSRKKARA